MIFEYNGLKINYEIFGEGKPILVLHGWMACIDAMAPIYNFFKNNRKVVVLDFPGQGGKSDTLKDVWGVPEYAEMVRALIKELNIEGTDVIGHSFGGRVIIYLASNYKELFNKIILVDSAGVKPKTSIKKLAKIYSYKMVKNIYKLFLPKEKFESKMSELRAKRGSSDYSKLDSDVMRESFKKIINLDLTQNLKNISNSTLLIWGENDNDTPIYMAKIMEKNIKDSGLVVIEKAGHFSYLDNQSKFLNVANVFLN